MKIENLTTFDKSIETQKQDKKSKQFHYSSNDCIPPLKISNASDLKSFWNCCENVWVYFTQRAVPTLNSNLIFEIYIYCDAQYEPKLSPLVLESDQPQTAKQWSTCNRNNAVTCCNDCTFVLIQLHPRNQRSWFWSLGMDAHPFLMHPVASKLQQNLTQPNTK